MGELRWHTSFNSSRWSKFACTVIVKKGSICCSQPLLIVLMDWMNEYIVIPRSRALFLLLFLLLIDNGFRMRFSFILFFSLLFLGSAFDFEDNYQATIKRYRIPSIFTPLIHVGADLGVSHLDLWTRWFPLIFASLCEYSTSEVRDIVIDCC